MKSILSFGYFLHKLRSIETIKLDVFKEIFLSYGDGLAKGLEFYRPRRIESNAKDNLMKEIGIEGNTASFVVELSELLGLDSRQTYDVLCAYLLYDYVGPTRDINLLIDDDASKTTLFAELEKFYYREQTAFALSLIEILKCVQRSRDDLPHVAVLERFVSDKLATPAFVDSLLAALNSIWTKEVERKTILGFRSDISTRVASYFALQKHSVTILIWLFNVSDLPVECDVAVLKFLHKQNFGRKQFYGKLLQAYEADEYIDQLFYLEILLTLKAFRLDSLLTAIVDDTRDKDSIWLNPNSASTMDSCFKDLIPPSSHGSAGLALAYAINLQLRHSLQFAHDNERLESLEILDSAIQKYGSIARRNESLKSFAQLLSSSAITGDKDLLSVTRGLVYVALDGCLQFFEAASIGSIEDLMWIFCNVLQDASVADAFWAKDFTTGASSFILQQVIYRFYANFEQPLQVLSNLAGASTESCRKVVKLLTKLPVLSEPAVAIEAHELAPVENIGDDEEDNGETPVVLLKPRQPFGCDGPLLPAGTLGRIIVGPSEFVQWEFSFNAWQLCLLEITKATSEASRVSSVLNVVGQILRTDPTSANLFAHFLNQAVAVLKRVRYFETELWISLLEPCFRCLSAAGKVFPYEIISQVSNDDILPNLRPLSEGEFHMSLIERIMNDVERLSGQYDCTVAFLQLIEVCCDQMTSCYDSAALSGSVSYICGVVLRDFLSWPYENQQQRNEIAKISLRICRKIIEKETATDEIGAGLKAVVDICRNSLTNGDPRRTLLRLCCVGVDAFRDLCNTSSNGFAQEDMVEIVSLALALLLELLVHFEKSKKGSPTPSIFMEMFAAVSPLSATGGGPPLRTIAQYLMLGMNDRIPKLAIVCLKKVSKIFPATLLSTLGEWASAFCDVLLSRLESPAEDTQLKVHCIEFLTTCIRFQPGLAEKLLGVSSEDSGVGNAKDQPPPTSVDSRNGDTLDCVLALMKSDRLSPDLAIACANLLAGIWRSNMTVAMDYLRQEKKDEFWPVLLAPLSPGEEGYFLTITSPIVRILTRELVPTWIVSGSTSKTKLTDAARDNAAVVSSVVKEVVDTKRMKLTFKKMAEYCGSRVDVDEKVEVIGAWMNFLQVVLANATTRNCLSLSSSFPLDDAKDEILVGSANVLRTALDHFDNQGSVAVVRSASELWSLALRYCLPARGSAWNWTVFDLGWIIKDFGAICDRLNSSYVEEWCLQLSAIILPTCYPIFGLITSDAAESLSLIFDSFCSILVKVLTQTAALSSKNLLDAPLYPWKKALLSLLRSLAIAFPKLNSAGKRKALDDLQKHSAMRNLCILLELFLAAGRFDVEIFSCTCLVFGVLSQSLDSLSIINHSGFLEWMCVKLVVAPKAISLDLDVLTAVLAVYSSMLQANSHRAVSACTTFLASYSDTLAQLMRSFHFNFSTKHAEMTSKLLRLLVLLADHKERWIFEARESLDLMKDAVSLLCYRLPPFLAKPAALAECVGQQERAVIKAPTSLTDSNLGLLKQQLIEIVYLGMQFLLRFSPELMDVCNNPSFDAAAFPPLLILDLNTNLTPTIPSQADDTLIGDSAPVLTFGAVLLVVHLCVNSLRKSEMAKSASPSADRSTVQQRVAAPLAIIDKTSIASLLDSALYLLLSQASLYLRQGDFVDAWQQALLKRDLAAELSQYLSRCGVRASGSAGSTPRKSPATTPGMSAASPGASVRAGVVGVDVAFLRFVSDFVRNVLRNVE